MTFRNCVLLSVFLRATTTTQQKEVVVIQTKSNLEICARLVWCRILVTLTDSSSLPVQNQRAMMKFEQVFVNNNRNWTRNISLLTFCVCCYVVTHTVNRTGNNKKSWTLTHSHIQKTLFISNKNELIFFLVFTNKCSHKTKKHCSWKWIDDSKIFFKIPTSFLSVFLQK